MEGMTTPDDLDRELTLRSATARFDQLRRLDDDEVLSKEQALQRLALSEVIARKARYGRQLDVRSARRVGASWSEIGAALGTTKQAAWDAHDRWLTEQADPARQNGYHDP